MSSQAPPPYTEKNNYIKIKPSAPYSRQYSRQIVRNNYMPVSEYGTMYEGVYKKPNIKNNYTTYNNINNNINNNFVNRIPRKRQIKYHGPVTEYDEKLKITTKYFDERTNTETTNITLIDKNMLRNNNIHTIDQRNLDRNIRIDGIDPLPIFIDGHLARNNYFNEQKRILKNKYDEDLLKLESQRIYSQIAYK